MTVVRVDLRLPAVRARLREIPPPGSADPFPFSDPSALTDLPVRLLLIVPLDDIAATDAEELALKLLGSDPSPRTLVALVAVGGGVGPGPAPRRLDAFARTLPAALGRHPDVRFLDLRAEMLSFGHPRTGLTRLTGDDGHHWPEAFVRDLVAHLAQVEIFDAVWSTVPADRPATVGMRIASLGEGRERAVADLALRLSRELDPAGEPSMASKLPKRWDVDPRLLPAQAPYPQPAASVGQVPPAVRGLANVSHDGPFRLLSRRLEAYNEGVRTVIGELEDRPAELSRLLREAQRTREGAPGIDPIGAAKLDAAHRVAVVDLPVVVRVHVAHGGRAAALGHDRVRLAEQGLGDDRGLLAVQPRLDRRAQPGSARAHDHHVVRITVVFAGHATARSVN